MAAVPGNLEVDLAALNRLSAPCSTPWQAGRPSVVHEGRPSVVHEGRPSVVHEGRQWVEAHEVTIPADSSTCVDTLRLHLPDQPSPWLLQASLWQNGHLSAHNEYDLSYHDERAMPLLRRALSLLGRWLLH